MAAEETTATARVVMVQDDLVTIEVIETPNGYAKLMKNEMVYVCPHGTQEKLKAEVLRVRGRTADAQVYEETRGVAIGDWVEQTGEMLSVALGPGLLGQVYDGLQNPLEAIAADHGFFLARGAEYPGLDTTAKWSFTPHAQAGATLDAGGVLGVVQEGRLTHKILVPFDEPGPVEVQWTQRGNFTVDTPIASIRDSQGRERPLTMVQRWPVRKPIPSAMVKRRLVERLYPSEPMTTTQRIIDVFFPIARGGTACIPGPFGAGKTVLQHLVSRHADVDIVIVIACGERAGEVVETITEFPELTDPRTGGALMDRTIIIANTSSMPVAAREASIYTGITLGEYYRQMGFNVLCIADSTSRWAQAMRETSGRLEEIPGEEAFPAYLDSSIKNVYERAGVIRAPDGSVGSVTLIGTVSPAGGNFEEPVTQATLATVKTFLGLSAARAYKRFYPAIDPLISWSRYLEQLEEWFAKNLRPDWVESVQAVTDLLRRGAAVEQMMQVTGEEGITVEDFVILQKSVMVDMVFLQQDAFDKIDASMPQDRQIESFLMLKDLVERSYDFDTTEKAREFFTRLTGLYKNLNYSEHNSPGYKRYLSEIEALAEQNRARPKAASS
jgi:V/A-type H+-transporting ATPase subunit A